MYLHQTHQTKLEGSGTTFLDSHGKLNLSSAGTGRKCTLSEVAKPHDWIKSGVRMNTPGADCNSVPDQSLSSEQLLTGRRSRSNSSLLSKMSGLRPSCSSGRLWLINVYHHSCADPMPLNEFSNPTFGIIYSYHSKEKGSQHLSPNVKTPLQLRTESLARIDTSRDANSACFKGS